ncbi:MAG: hypothetical protein RJB11_1099, partial [Planctomycetota bacterium]
SDGNDERKPTGTFKSISFSRKLASLSSVKYPIAR